MTRSAMILAILAKFGQQTRPELLARLGCTTMNLDLALETLTDRVTLDRDAKRRKVYRLRHNAI